MLNYIEFYGDGFGRDVISADSPEIEGIEGNWPLRVGEIRQNPATIVLAKFFVYVIAGSDGFERVAVLPIGSVRKAPFYSPFQMRVTQKSGTKGKEGKKEGKKGENEAGKITWTASRWRAGTTACGIFSASSSRPLACRSISSRGMKLLMTATHWWCPVGHQQSCSHSNRQTAVPTNGRQCCHIKRPKKWKNISLDNQQ